MKIKHRQKIAIIGTGISGMGAASLLYPHHDIIIYEKNSVIGGHSRTVEVTTPDSTVPVDTGFIVFNFQNYPLLTKMFAHLSVPITKSDMSFGASINNGWLEYGTQKSLSIFSQKRNLLRPQFWGMLYDILRFNKHATKYLYTNPSISLGQCLDELNMGQWFRNYFLLPMGGAIWSTPIKEMLDFPASSFIRFFDNHGLLTINQQPQWYTVTGGSREYIKRLTAPFKDSIKLDTPVKKVLRKDGSVIVSDTKGNSESFDQVILSCHADQALKMIENPTSNETRVLRNFTYQKNRMVLHSDLSFMPKNKRAWSSWVYLSENDTNNHSAVSLTYWMNQLQPLTTKTPLLVTLNPSREPKKELIHDEEIFEHPVFDESAIRAQLEIPSIQGLDKIWFCGAYQRYGFHEDGLASAVAMVQQMGIEPTWI